MKHVIVPRPTPSTCEPVTCGRELGDCWVGGKTLAELQRGCLNRVVGTVLPVFLRTDAWVPCVHLCELVADGVASVYVAEDGEALAWVGGSADGPAGNSKSVPLPHGCFPIRHPWDFLAINERVIGQYTESVIDGELSERAQIDGILHLGTGSRILPGVYIEGKVMIGGNCKIGPNCYIRGFTAIGDDCHIGQSVEIKNSIIMPGVSIGHLSYCGDSIIGRNTNFGAGTTTANLRHDGTSHQSMVAGELIDTGRRKLGAIVGDDVHTGINTSIYPGRKIWPGMSTRPADIVQRDLNP